MWAIVVIDTNTGEMQRYRASSDDPKNMKNTEKVSFLNWPLDDAGYALREVESQVEEFRRYGKYAYNSGILSPFKDT